MFFFFLIALDFLLSNADSMSRWHLVAFLLVSLQPLSQQMALETMCCHTLPRSHPTLQRQSGWMQTDVTTELEAAARHVWYASVRLSRVVHWSTKPGPLSAFAPDWCSSSMNNNWNVVGNGEVGGMHNEPPKCSPFLGGGKSHGSCLFT